MSKVLKRNDPCHCGSGENTRTVMQKEHKKTSSLDVLGCLISANRAFSLIPNNKENGSGNQYTSKPYLPQNIGKNKPEGEAPPGRSGQQSMDTGTMQTLMMLFQQV